MKIVVVVPTYNERENIVALINALEVEFPSMPGHNFEILVVDGNSPDGTAAAAEEVGRKFGNVTVITEKEKRGLGMAYVWGMKYAAENMKADAILEFDADFQHDPADIKRLVSELDNGYDYIIGSRYVSGGSVPKSWGYYRKILSRAAGLLCKLVLWLPTNDNTSGFKLTRVAGFINKLPLDENKILSFRYAYKVHLLYEMIRLGARVKEVPIAFGARGGGVSKSNFKDISDTLRVIFTLKLRDLKKIWK